MTEETYSRGREMKIGIKVKLDPTDLTTVGKVVKIFNKEKSAVIKFTTERAARISGTLFVTTAKTTFTGVYNFDDLYFWDKLNGWARQ